MGGRVKVRGPDRSKKMSLAGSGLYRAMRYTIAPTTAACESMPHRDGGQESG